MIKAIFYDLDGTLLDTLADIVASTNTILAKHGLTTHDYESYKQFIGNGARVLIERASQLGNTHMVDLLLTEYLAYYDEHSTELTAPYQGILEVLEACQEKGIAISVVSNKPHASTVKTVKHYFPHIRFFAIEGQSDGIPAKPDPVKVLRILDELGISPSEAIFVGDSNVDILTGQNANLRTIGCCYGFRGKEELKAAKADILIDKPSEILNYIN